jgi:hypothetical protein
MCSPYEQWHRHFTSNLRDAPSLPWNDPHGLSAREGSVVTRSIQQFQLGEYARGRGLRRRAAAHPVLGADPWFLPALDLFIAEEQEHSRLLGMFLDHERIPRLARDWVDAVFRRLRKLAGLDACVSVLVTAEVLAVPFYTALRDATQSRLLRAICTRILRDEAAHLKYQALTLGMIRRRLSRTSRALRSLCHRVLFDGTSLMLWRQHRTVFRAAGWEFAKFWWTAHHWFALLDARVHAVHSTAPPSAAQRAHRVGA